MSKKQSLVFNLLGLTCKRVISSHTQCGIAILSPEGKEIATFDGSAPYDKKSLTHVCRDGRENPWQVTDAEFSESIKASLHTTLPIYESKIFKAIKAEISKQLKLKKVTEV